MPEPEYICIGCGAAMAVDHVIRPGETQYKCSAACGGRGMERVADPYEAPARKKPNVKPYHESPYRGGRLTG